MGQLPWIQYTERMVGDNHPSLSDTLNRASQSLLSLSGYDSDATTFPGLYGPVFNVTAYGAASGFTDSTAAIQAAIDAQAAAGNGIVWLPGSLYAVTNLRYYTNTILKGSGIQSSGVGGCTLFQLSGATPVLSPNGNRMESFLLEDFVVYGGANASNTGGIDLTGATKFTVRRVAVTTCKVGNIIVLGGTTAGDSGFANFEDVRNSNAVNDHWRLGSSATDQPDGLNFTDCHTNGSGASFIHYVCTGGRAGPGSNRWSGCTFEGAPTAAITVDAAGAGMNVFDAVRFENTGGGGLTFTLFGISTATPFGYFDGCTIAPGAGGITWTDNGPVLSSRINEYGPSGHVLNRFARAIEDKSVALTSGVAPAINLDDGNNFTLAVLTNIAAVIAVPLNPPPAGFSKDITITIRNASGGALSTAPTFNTGAGGFKFSAVTNPANGTQVVYRFRWDPTQSFFYEVGTHLAAGI